MLSALINKTFPFFLVYRSVNPLIKIVPITTIHYCYLTTTNGKHFLYKGENQ